MYVFHTAFFLIKCPVTLVKGFIIIKQDFVHFGLDLSANKNLIVLSIWNQHRNKLNTLLTADCDVCNLCKNLAGHWNLRWRRRKNDMETCSTLYYFNCAIYFFSIFACLDTIAKGDIYTCESSYGNLFTRMLYTD